MNGGEKTRAWWAECGGADRKRCSDLGLLVCFAGDLFSRDYWHDFGHKPACIAIAINTEGRMPRAGYSPRCLDFEHCSEARPSDGWRLAVPTLYWADRPRVPGAGRHHVHQGR